MKPDCLTLERSSRRCIDMRRSGAWACPMQPRKTTFTMAISRAAPSSSPISLRLVETRTCTPTRTSSCPSGSWVTTCTPLPVLTTQTIASETIVTTASAGGYAKAFSSPRPPYILPWLARSGHLTYCLNRAHHVSISVIRLVSLILGTTPRDQHS
jgi:hypothetical protein